MNNYEYIDTLINNIKAHLEKTINEEYTEYKNKCLEDLNNKLEYKRNDIVRDILNGIDISINSNEPYSFEPTILIKVEKKVFIKE